MRGTRKLSRRSFFERVAGGVAGGALALVGEPAKAAQVSDHDPSDPSGQGRGAAVSDQDSGAGADPAGRGRGSGSRQGTGVSDSDSGAGADPAGRGRGGGSRQGTGVSDSDSGASADPAGRGRGGGDGRRTAPAGGCDVRGTWRLLQSNGTEVTLSVSQTGSDIRGRGFFNPIGAYGSRNTQGTFQGEVVGREVNFRVTWEDGQIGVYNGRISAGGILSGNSYSFRDPSNRADWYVTRAFPISC